MYFCTIAYTTESPHLTVRNLELSGICFLNLGKTHPSVAKRTGPCPPTQGLLNGLLIPPRLGPSPSPPTSQPLVQACAHVSFFLHVHPGSWLGVREGALHALTCALAQPHLRESCVFCVCRHAGACLTLEPEFLSQHSKGEDGGECVVGGKEWIGSTCSAFSWQSSSSPGSRWGLGGHTLHLLLSRSMGRCPEQVHQGRKAVSLSSPSSWDHQLGLALRSIWDIEIPDCP